jgi:hypothetical protein
LTSLSSIESDLKLPVDCSDCATAATHPVRNFGKSHIAFAQQHDDSVQFILGKVFTLRPNHVGLLPDLSMYKRIQRFSMNNGVWFNVEKLGIEGSYRSDSPK